MCIFPTVPVPPEVQSVSYNKCKFPHIPRGQVNSQKCSEARASPRGAHRFVPKRLWLPDSQKNRCYAGHSQMPEPTPRIPPRWRLARVKKRRDRWWQSGDSSCGIVGVCAKMVGCGWTEMRRGLETSSGNSTKASFSTSLARATTVLTAHGIQARSLRRHF